MEFKVQAFGTALVEVRSNNKLHSVLQKNIFYNFWIADSVLQKNLIYNLWVAEVAYL